MNKKLLSAAVGATLALSAASAQAYATFFGEDKNNSGSVPLATTPNSTSAENAFLALLTGVGTETFEGIAAGTTAPLALAFPGAGTATLTGSSGSVVAVTPGTTNGAGRYSVPSPTSSHFWQVNAGTAGSFTVNFSAPVAAFGFYGIDIGDYGGQLQLSLSSGTTLTVPNTVGSNGSTDGSVLFYGFIAANPGELVNSVNFITTTGQGDVFAFDRFTIGSQQQVHIPEPASLALLGLGLAGLAFSTRRKAAPAA